MTRNRKPTLRRRQLGRELRELREAAGISLDEAAPQLDISTSSLSRIEKGQQAVTVHVVRSMLDLYDVGGPRWAQLIELTRQARKPGWWRAYGIDDFGYIPLEAEATLVRTYVLGLVPGLLQTEDYARALFEAAVLPLTPEELDAQVLVRMIRQRRLVDDDYPLELITVVDESALRRPIGGRNVMRAQLNRLVEAAELDRVTLQVLPAHVGARPALSGDFIVLSFDLLGLPDMAYAENALGSAQIEEEALVTRASMVFDRLRSLALSPTDSVALIRKLAEQT